MGDVLELRGRTALGLDDTRSGQLCDARSVETVLGGARSRGRTCVDLGIQGTFATMAVPAFRLRVSHAIRPWQLATALVASGCGSSQKAHCPVDPPRAIDAISVLRLERNARLGASLTPPCTRPDARFAYKEYAPLPLSVSQRQQIVEADTFVADHAADPVARAELVQKKYSRAKVLFDAKHWTEAAVAYLDIALNFPDDDLGAQAVYGYLESTNILGSRAEPPRPSCFDDMLHFLRIFLDTYCRGDVGARRAPTCLLLFHIQRDSERSLEQLDSERTLFPAGSSHNEETVEEQYAEAAALYLQQATTCCDAALRFGSSPHAERCDELAFYAGKAAMRAGLRLRAKKALAILRDPINGLEKSAFTDQLVKIIDGSPASR